MEAKSTAATANKLQTDTNRLEFPTVPTSRIPKTLPHLTEYPIWLLMMPKVMHQIIFHRRRSWRGSRSIISKFKTMAQAVEIWTRLLEIMFFNPHRHLRLDLQLIMESLICKTINLSSMTSSRINKDIINRTPKWFPLVRVRLKCSKLEIIVRSLDLEVAIHIPISLHLAPKAIRSRVKATITLKGSSLVVVTVLLTEIRLLNKMSMLLKEKEGRVQVKDPTKGKRWIFRT